MVDIPLGHTEEEGVLLIFNRTHRATTIEQHTLKITHSNIGIDEVFTHIVEEVCAITHRKAWGTLGIVRAEHHITHTGNRKITAKPPLDGSQRVGLTALTLQLSVGRHTLQSIEIAYSEIIAHQK